MVDSVNTGSDQPTEQTAAPEGHDQRMAENFDKAQQNEAPTLPDSEKEGGEGEKILGKFDSVEDLQEAYKQLEQKLSQGGQEKEQAPAAEAPTPEQQTERQQQAEEAVSKAEGVDMESLSQEYMENGDLTENSYKALEQAGISREFVAEYVRGQEALAEKFTQEATEAVGGPEEYQRMAQWASQFLNPEQLEAYNREVDSGDPHRMKLAVQSLAFQYSQSRPSEPSLVGGANGQGGNGFQSVAELTEAMKDPRYEKDPAYRKSIESRLANSNIL